MKVFWSQNWQFWLKWLKFSAQKRRRFLGLCNSLLMGLGQDQQQLHAVHTRELPGEGPWLWLSVLLYAHVERFSVFLMQYFVIFASLCSGVLCPIFSCSGQKRGKSNVLAIQNCMQWPSSYFLFPNSKHSIQSKKNPAYGRQSISRPMRIVAPIPQ